MDISEENKTYIENVLNWTFSGSRFYYRDTNEDLNVENIYKAGKIIKAGFFIDASLNAKKPDSRIRFIIGSAHAAEIYKTDFCSPFTRECELCVFHPNSFFKIMDIYKVKEQYQIFLFHIPLHGIPILENASFNFNNENTTDYFVERARASFDEKLKMDIDEKLESPKWKKRTNDPVGIKADGSLFPPVFELSGNSKIDNLEMNFRKIAGDLDPLNLPTREEMKWNFI